MSTRRYIKTKSLLLFILFLIMMGIFAGQGSANSNKILSHGQSVYVPIYSHIYHGNQERIFNLTATLSIRNTNLKNDIILYSIDYFASNGELLKSFVELPVTLKKFTTVRYIIKANDKSGGSGAKFIVRWKSKKFSNAPIIEAIMVSTQNQQGISFVSRGQAIHE
jgi:hypothetical protein